MSPSRRRAPRVGAQILIAVLLVALAASVSPLVPYAWAIDPTLDPGASPTVTLDPTTDPTADPTADPPSSTDPAPTPDPPTPADPTPTPDPAPEPSASGPTASASPEGPLDQIPLYALVAPGPGGDGPTEAVPEEIVGDLIAAGFALAGPLGPSSFITPHIDNTLTGDTCAACHRAHTAENKALLAEAAPQSGLCFTCHDGSGSILDVQADFTNPSVSSHPATTDLGHIPGVGDEFAGRLERHATCTDCHDPHNADGTPAAPGPFGWSPSGATRGASGVTVANGLAGTAPVYTLVRNVTLEYQLCLKCHSGYTQLPAPAGPPSTWALDKGIELNPLNGSYHPIEFAGTNQTDAMAASLAGGTLWQFGIGDTVRCVNCHADRTKIAADSAARLPSHTSTNPSLLIAPYRDRLLKPTGEVYDPNDFALCYLCHDPAPFTDGGSTATNFELHAKHLTDIGGAGSADLSIDAAGAGQGKAICAECHFRLHSTAFAYDGDGVDRGIGNSRLVNFAPNVLANAGDLVWAAGPSGSCTLTCHGKSHGDEGYGPLAAANVGMMAGVRISIASSGTSQVGDPITFTVTVEQGSGSDFVPVPGVTVVANVDGLGEIDAAASTCDDMLTDDLGQCVVVVTSGVTGDTSVSASVVVGDVTGAGQTAAAGVTRAAAPDGPLPAAPAVDGDGVLTVRGVGSWVDARISIAASGTKLIGEAHTFIVTVERDSGSGFVPASGVTLVPIVGGVGSPDLDASTCDDTGTDFLGACEVVVVSDAAGQSLVRAIATVTVPGVIGSADVIVDTSGHGATTVENLVTWDDPSAPVPATVAPAVVEEPVVVPLPSLDSAPF